MEHLAAVGPRALVGLNAGVKLLGPIDAVLEGWGALALRDTRYRIEKPSGPTTALQTWRFEGGVALGLGARF